MKKSLLMAAAAAGLFAATPAAAQYFTAPSLRAGQNPGALNTDDEYPAGGGAARWLDNVVHEHGHFLYHAGLDGTGYVAFCLSVQRAAGVQFQSCQQWGADVYDQCHGGAFGA